MDSFGRLARESWDQNKLLAVSFVGFAVALLIAVGYTLVQPSDVGFRVVCVVVVALVLNTIALMILARRPPQRPSPPPPPPDGPDDLPPAVFNLRYFRSEHSKHIAVEYNRWCEDDTEENRFFVEMLIQRLHPFGADPHRHGYTIVRHFTAIPQLQQRVDEIMGADYAAIMDVGLRTASSANGKPRLDTLIFRDVELWRHPLYWQANEAIANNARLRRLFLYENTFFRPNVGGSFGTEQKQQIVGMFAGAMVHDTREWKWRPVNVDTPLPGVEVEQLFGPGEDGFEFQSSAAFAGHTAVFIWLNRNPFTIVHRFFSDGTIQYAGMVARYTNTFDQVFKREPKQTAEVLCTALRQEFPQAALLIEESFEDAKALVAGNV